MKNWWNGEIITLEYFHIDCFDPNIECANQSFVELLQRFEYLQRKVHYERFWKKKIIINEYNTYRAVPMLWDSLRNSPKIHESSCKLLKSSYPRIPEVIMLIMFLSESNSIPSGHCLRYKSYASPGIPFKKKIRKWKQFSV